MRGSRLWQEQALARYVKIKGIEPLRVLMQIRCDLLAFGGDSFIFLLCMVGTVGMRCSYGSPPAVFISSEDCYNVSKKFAPGTSTSPRAHDKVIKDFRCHLNHHARYGTAEEGTPPV